MLYSVDQAHGALGEGSPGPAQPPAVASLLLAPRGRGRPCRMALPAQCSQVPAVASQCVPVLEMSAVFHFHDIMVSQ